MRVRGWLVVGSIALGVTRLFGESAQLAGSNASYVTWTSAQAQQIGRSTRVTGRVGAGQGLLHTERALGYKLRATWLTGEVIRATARLLQLSDGLSNDHAETLVREAEGAGDTVIMVEIDPIEGSGVIPLDWVALLGPKGLRPGEPGMTKGTSVPKLREVRALSGVFRRDYDYEVFWVVFPLRGETGQPLVPDTASEAELVVKIYNNEGRVKWPVPESIRARWRAAGR